MCCRSRSEGAHAVQPAPGHPRTAECREATEQLPCATTHHTQLESTPHTRDAAVFVLDSRSARARAQLFGPLLQFLCAIRFGLSLLRACACACACHVWQAVCTCSSHRVCAQRSCKHGRCLVADMAATVLWASAPVSPMRTAARMSMWTLRDRVPSDPSSLPHPSVGAACAEAWHSRWSTCMTRRHSSIKEFSVCLLKC
jgi:hypothetical protein